MRTDCKGKNVKLFMCFNNCHVIQTSEELILTLGTGWRWVVGQFHAPATVSPVWAQCTYWTQRGSETGGEEKNLCSCQKSNTNTPLQIPPRLPEILADLSPILESKTKLCYGHTITFSTLNLQLSLSQAKKKVFTESKEDTQITRGCW